MGIRYMLFRPEEVREGDLYIEGIGGFACQIMKVYRVGKYGFTYGNGMLSGRQEFDQPLTGILVREAAEGIVMHLSEKSLGLAEKLHEEPEREENKQ